MSAFPREGRRGPWQANLAPDKGQGLIHGLIGHPTSRFPRIHHGERPPESPLASLLEEGELAGQNFTTTLEALEVGPAGHPPAATHPAVPDHVAFAGGVRPV